MPSLQVPANPVPALAAILLACGVCLCAALQYRGAETSYQAENRDPYLVDAQFERLRPIMTAVPESAVMGYLTDAQPGSVADSTMLLTAQYALAPRLLTRDSGPAWVLGNFTRPGDFASIGAAHGLQLAQDFGNGVVLFRKDSGTQ